MVAFLKLFYFIFGIIFEDALMPLIVSCTECIQLALEKRKGKMAVEVAKHNQEVQKLSEESEKPYEETNVIGFQAPDLSDAEEDEEEYEE